MKKNTKSDIIGKVKPTRKELDTLRQEVYSQNRKLILACVLILILSIGGFFGLRIFKDKMKPVDWTYEQAILDVYAGKITDNQYAYNGIIFARFNDQFLWKFQGIVKNETFEIDAHFGPKELEDIAIYGNAPQFVTKKKGLILTLNTSLDNVAGGAASAAIAAIEIGKIVGTKNNILNKPVLTTLTENTATTNMTTTASCANASTSIGVIQFEISNETKVTTSSNCILVQGTTPQNIIRAADALMYQILGIMRTNSNLTI